jgi:hypothetical protein
MCTIGLEDNVFSGVHEEGSSLSEAHVHGLEEAQLLHKKASSLKEAHHACAQKKDRKRRKKTKAILVWHRKGQDLPRLSTQAGQGCASLFLSSNYKVEMFAMTLAVSITVSHHGCCELDCFSLRW